MKICLEAGNVVDSIVISRDHMWGLSQDVLCSFTKNMNDCGIPDNVSFLKFSEVYQAIVGNQDEYSWNDGKNGYSNSNSTLGKATILYVS